ncbi:hypothetical protein ACFVWR_07155 [Leifsonia sp. NPDC058292]|uniref:hypothetical protein n=1 Tax=Leifsonia sp. NPDC058292 TaxID=3346428 RepID=UPI0036DA6912
MNTTKNSQNTPPAYWFGVIEHNLRSRMRDELADLGLRRGSWRILHTLADGPASAEDIQAELPPVRKGRGGHGTGHGRRGFGRGFRRGFGPGFGPGFDRFATDEERAAFVERAQADGERIHGDHHHGERPHDGRAHREHDRAHRIHAVLGDFAERGWVTFDGGAATLTDEGRKAHDAAFERIRDLRASVAAGISDADYATTMATLEAMARNLGWHAADTPR